MDDHAEAAKVPLGTARANQWQVSPTHADLVRAPAKPRPVTLVADNRIVTFDLSRTAIIVVDMQNDFCHADGWLAHIGVDVSTARTPIAPLSELLPVLRLASVPVIWLNWGNRPDRLNLSPALLHVYNPTGAGVGLGDPLPANGARVLEYGSWAAAIVEDLAVEPGDIHVAKYRMSGFQDTMLDSILRNIGVATLLFAGVNADQCVMCTLQDANFLGYDCLLIEDCTATTSPDFCMKATLYNVRQCFGFVVSSSALAAAICNQPSQSSE
jgi:nicotinamidase-related amidase